jgi:predicted unusual protein kinase regulating ubiquinone biosynthesis (AarF/ABC1/UbiB family)
MGMVEKPKGQIGRGFRIGRLGLALTGSYLGYQFQNLFLNEDQRPERRKSFNRKAAQQIRSELESLKGPVMKLGQIMSTQFHLLPEETLSELSKLQMRAPAMHPTLARAQFKASFGKFPEEVFRSFTAEPFAAASLGQVHRAVTKRGQEVAVKIQYPAIRKAIEDDFKLLRSAAFPARVMGHATESMIGEVERGMLQETDYVNEGRNIDFYRGQLKRLDYARVPFVDWDLSTERILTMSFIAGEPLPEFLANSKPCQELRDRIGLQLVELFHFQVRRLYTLHADPHPGNYLIDANGTIGLVDFGCVKKFSAEFIEIMRAFEEHIWLRGEEERRRMTRLIWGQEVLSKPRLAREVLNTAIDFYEMVFPGLSGKGRVVDFGDAKILKAMFRVLNDNLRHKTVNPEFAFYARAEMGLYNLLHLLHARIDTSAVFEKFGRDTTPDRAGNGETTRAK